ncbi:DUF2252 domain-containing protein [Methylomonas sp. AM2-LC]|uniref:DUF2252 domain-containing protein n=1 Tax=Methylomonas sp. AM2-LC TaxID=3153301 RepID=UPI0032646880
MQNPSLWARIEAFNKGRDPERLLLKYQAMQNDIFSFLRGTCHLFYQDWPQVSELNQAPLAWISGDQHLENFGSYKGDNRLSYFDLNDFDEAILAPCTWDLARFLCSLLVGAQTLGVEQAQALKLCEAFMSSYTYELTECKPRWIERSTATGMIRYLLKNLKRRSRVDLLNERTTIHHGERRLKLDGIKTLPINAEDKQRVIELIDRFAARQEKPEFFHVVDVARRIAGVGSLGLERYVIMIQGKGTDNHYLLDLKYQPGSALSPYVTNAQPLWQSEAERVVALQHRSQAISPAFLSVINEGKRSYVLRELMPQQDRLHLRHWNGKFQRLQKVVQIMGKLVAWQHIRTGGWKGSAIADEWQSFGQKSDWQQPLLDYALSYSRQVRLDWLSFKEDFGSNLPGASD